ncbi:methyl-accepting chemotaxis protein [Lysinibacillus sp. OL1_EC]|uniref:methyl-accepting chemotaxis protein n=1 Tax=unclassified Lysinibacillus TaxID=2636778 RepID=UPI00103EA199|nr:MULTISPECIES: methyl-accepting chemotaxis protein [unclassified Lysinibacillus]MCM0624223.1 methyl-accepting chemotaxis protein [Lysinibacillus sp. OL1_EC]TBV88502.1 methyl-accepting chemotaxis protein [Lysinibacillus sp. OL1]
MKLLHKILLTTLSTMMFVFIIILSVNIVKTNSLAVEDARQLAQSRASESAYQMQMELDYAMDTARTVASNLQTMVANHKGDRDLANEMLKQLLEQNDTFLGVWTIWEPNAFDGQDAHFANLKGHDTSGRFLPYWARSNKGVTLAPLEDYETSDYYVLPKTLKQEVILEPLTYPIDGQEVLMTSTAIPIQIDGKVVGLVGIDISLETLVAINNEIVLYDTGYSAIVSHKGSFVSHPSPDYVNRPVTEMEKYKSADKILSAVEQGKPYLVEDYSTYLQEASFIAVSPIQIGQTSTPWALQVIIPSEEVMAAASEAMWLSILLAIIGIIVLVGAITWIAQRIVKPVVQTVEQVKTIAGGNLAVEPLQVRSKDEIGELAHAMNHMTDNMRELLQAATHISNQVNVYSGELRASTNDMSISIEQVLTTTSELATGATVQAEQASTTLGVTQEVEQKLQAIQMAIEEMLQDSQHTTASSKQGLIHAEQSIQGMVVMSEKVSLTAMVVQQLSDQSTEINRILQVINAIAGQTNLLALNAAIEAARAGEHGKGFSIVAEEVRKLAEESAKSTSQIASIIDMVVREAAKASDAMQTVVLAVENNTQYIDANKQALDAILRHIVDTVAQIDNVTAASSVIQRETQEVVRAVENMTAVSQQSSAGTEELMATMEQQNLAVHDINNKAQQLTAMTDSLQAALAKFQY